MTALLPRIDTHERYVASSRDEQTYLAAVQAICNRHRLPSDALSKYPTGSTIVFAVGSAHVIKLFEPIFDEAAQTELTVLAHVQGRLAIPTPSLHASGELEGWRYIVMGQLRGRSLADAWESIASEERLALCRAVGEAVAGLHSLPPPEALPGPSWPDFIRRQAGQCVEQQRSNGLSDYWLEQIPSFLAAQDVDAAAEAAQVLLHTEIMREHLLVEQRGERRVLSGLFDFEPARLGAAEYELASVGIFLTAREPGLLRSFLNGYGYADAELTEELQERMLLHTLLHRYSKLRWYLERLPPRNASTLHELAREWFAFS